MSKYNFVDTTAKASTTGYINSESPKFQTYDNYFLEQLVDDFTILSVVGREIVPHTILANVNEYTDGQYFFGSKFEPRELEFTYQITAKTSSELMDKYKRLNYFLMENGELMFSFQDELLYYKGLVTSVGETPTGTLKHISTFTITCSDPYKYSASKKITGTGTIYVNREALSKSTSIESVKITVSNVANSDFKLVGHNNSYKTDNNQSEVYEDRIVFNKDKIKVGDVILLDYSHSITFLNGLQNDSILHWTSDFETFEDYADYIFTFSSNTVEITYRHRYI